MYRSNVSPRESASSFATRKPRAHEEASADLPSCLGVLAVGVVPDS